MGQEKGKFKKSFKELVDILTEAEKKWAADHPAAGVQLNAGN